MHIQICYMYLVLRSEAVDSFMKHNLVTVKPVLSSHSKRTPNIGFQDRLSLNAGQKYFRMLQWEHSAILLTLH